MKCFCRGQGSCEEGQMGLDIKFSQNPGVSGP